jgi:hypothetical protein
MCGVGFRPRGPVRPQSLLRGRNGVARKNPPAASPRLLSYSNPGPDGVSSWAQHQRSLPRIFIRGVGSEGGQSIRIRSVAPWLERSPTVPIIEPPCFPAKAVCCGKNESHQGALPMRCHVSLAVLAIISALATAGSIWPAPAQARQDQYCLQGRAWGYPGNCQFSSYAQCMASASGTDAYCGINPQYGSVRPRGGYRDRY